MKELRSVIKLLMVVVLIGGQVACEKVANEVYVNDTTSSKRVYSVFELKVLREVNDYRILKELPKLQKMDIISSVAYKHSLYMAQNEEASHDNFPERNQYLKENVSAKSVGENVASGYGTAQGVVRAWLNSEAHRRVIEKEEYSHFGISVEKDMNARNYFTLLFIER